MSTPSITLPARQFDAVLFDLDGVVTQTASLHAAAWKALFDEYLRRRAARDHTPFRPFKWPADYLRYIDGKPRYAGVESFLQSRGIALPHGAPADGPERETVCGLGNRKNALFLELLRTQGVEVFDSTVTLIRALKARGLKTAVVSSSANCAAIVAAAGLTELFDTRVDGVDLTALGLRGKPAPDTFLLAAGRLGVAPARAVVVEDAIAGVEAGRNGKFGLVIGVARHGDHQTLREHGADVVVDDLAAIELDES
jgi:beta-phosphoglucomutase family hydrolase